MVWGEVLDLSERVMVEIDWSRCATVARQHQKDGVDALVRRPLFMLADEVGAGKSKQVIDSAQILFEDLQRPAQERNWKTPIDTVVVTFPAFARGVWANPNAALGEV